MKLKFEPIYQQNKQSVYTYLYCMTKDEEIAKDLCQEVFLKVYLNMRKFRGDCSIKTWCMIIAKNTFLIWLKKKKPITIQIQENEIENNYNRTTPEQEVLCKERGEFIKHILFMLKEEYRTLLILRDYEELSYKEIGLITGFSEAKVKVGIYRARAQYKKLFNQLGGEINEM